MPRYQFKQFGTNDGHREVLLKSDAETVDELLILFAEFLAGCGYHLKGELDVVEEE